MEGAGKNRPAPPRVIAVTTFDGISPFHLAVPCVVFGDVHPGAPVSPDPCGQRRASLLPRRTGLKPWPRPTW